MHRFTHPLMRHPRPAINPPPVDSPQGDDSGVCASSNPPMPGSFPENDDPPTPHQPSVLDVLVVKAMMTKALTLPLELVNRIIDFAEYWPHTSAQLDYGGTPHPVARGSSPLEDVFLLRTLPLGLIKQVNPDPRHYQTEEAKLLRLSSEHPVEQFHKWTGSPSHTVQHPCRKIVFTITSSDQGWGGMMADRGTYRHSFTWFEAGLERIDASGECGDYCPDHARQAMDPSSSDSTTRPDISPCAMRPIVPALVGEPEKRLRMEHPLAPLEEYMIQCNKTASRDGPHTHVVEWRADDNIDPDTPQAQELVNAGRGRATGTGEFVRNLKLGDVITVWAKARFVGWQNNLKFLKVDVYWAV
ncbi:hypothetical protein MAPG_11609 [Magnaporthiopsis poae ATCC 64411]|uniref:Uncharacterized protein n=1 Tax=Magnaporthiopsis poae (strain ATCC 64411 / 73-15) TaxID=644358 RepID=A0A0C4EFQ3_MAGP6|nr:hypothetical protein MAPG_11609 [Magnaporthiopsis poae ATCC 64411]